MFDTERIRNSCNVLFGQRYQTVLMQLLLKGFNHLSDLGVKRVFSMESLSCQTTCKSHLYLASHLPTSFLQILLNCGESQQGSVWDSQEGAKLACICKLPWELLHHTAQGRQALNLHLGECQERNKD